MSHETHYACNKALKESGGSTECCFCIGHYCGNDEAVEENACCKDSNCNQKS